MKKDKSKTIEAENIGTAFKKKLKNLSSLMSEGVCVINDAKGFLDKKVNEM